MDGITSLMDRSLSKLQEMVMDRDEGQMGEGTMTIHRNLWAGYETYFIRMGSSGRYATGIALRNIHGEWRMDFATRYYASDLRHDKEHFPVVGSVDIKAVVKDAVLKAVEPKEG